MKKYILFLTLFVFELLSLVKQWVACSRFVDSFHNSAFDLSLRLIESTHNDKGFPIFFVRLFHNKLAGTLLDTYGHYVQYWNSTFLVGLVSFVGFFGLLFSIWYGFQEKKRMKRYFLVILSFSLLFPVVEIFFNLHIAFIGKLLLFSLPLTLLSLFGWARFLEGGRVTRYLFFFVCLFASVLWFLGGMQDIFSFCVQ